MLSPQELKDTLQDPRETVKNLSKYIIGQESAKKALSILALNRSMMLLSKFDLLGPEKDLNIHKTNVLLIGPTGSGKSSIVKALGEVMDMPITTFDCTSITEAGYIGGKVEDILVRYVEDHISYWSHNSPLKKYQFLWNENLNEDENAIHQKLFETGIIFIDEIDKIADRGAANWKGKSEHIQNELLKFLEGSAVDITSHSQSSKKQAVFREAGAPSSVDTTDLFFIMGGAFAGLDEIIRARLNKKAGIGFSSSLPNVEGSKESTNLIEHVTTDDLIKYGFKPEFVGRIPVRVSLSGMTKELLMQIILTSEDSPYKRHVNFFKPFGIDLKIEKGGLEAIADRALGLNTGARALNNIFFDVLQDHIMRVYELTDKKISITKAMVKGAKINEV